VRGLRVRVAVVMGVGFQGYMIKIVLQFVINK
jgi:hypothetical protein